MTKIEQLYVDLGPIPGNIHDQGTCIKSELKEVRGGSETVSIPRLLDPMGLAQLSPQSKTERTLSY